MKVLSLNINNFGGRDSYKPLLKDYNNSLEFRKAVISWRDSSNHYKNASCVLNLIREKNPDIVFLQEFDVTSDTSSKFIKSISLQAMKIYSTLMEFKDDLIEGEECVNIITLEGKKEINVVCSDQVGGGFGKKSEFYAYIKDRFGGSVHVNFLSSVSKSIDYLVWAGADGSPARYTSKVQKVENWNEKGSSIPILTADMFIEEMERMG